MRHTKRSLLEAIDAKLDLLLASQRASARREKDMSAQLDKLKAQVERCTTVSAGVKTLVTGLSQQIRDLRDDPAELDRLADQLDSDLDGLTTLVETNTDPQQPPQQPARTKP